MKYKIKLFDPVFGKKEEQAILKVLQSRFWASGSGSGNVKIFETNFKKFINTKKCVAVNNGTSALHLALSLMDIKGKEVILPSLSFVSTAHAVIYNGGIPIFADIDPKTLCIDPVSIEEKITNKTKVILPVHFAGLPSNLNEIQKLCKKQNIKLVEDAAHAAGSVYNNKKIGTHGNAVCFSFHPVKNLAMPTGGAITINDKKSKTYENELKIRRWCGITSRIGTTYDISELGWNFYMNEFAAAVGIEQLKKLDFLNKKRKKIAERYFKEIKSEQKMPIDIGCSYHFYWICVNNRKKFMKKMNDKGIETGIHYRPIHTMTMYKNKKIKLHETEKVGENVVSIPTHPNLSNMDVNHIISSINKFQNI
jgi:dTDP-4-amino-4,6-dideoxygalactose transaminase